jgi:hypothetical protein
MQKIIQLQIWMMLLIPLIAHSEEEHWYNYDHLYLQAGTYDHYKSDDDHAGNDILISLEAIRSDDYFYGLALFDNSFDQFSQYLYAGKTWHYYGKWEGFHTRLSAGLIHGYKDDYEDKIPFNDLGIAPAIIPTVGYKNGRFGADLIFLGTAGIVFSLGMDI